MEDQGHYTDYDRKRLAPGRLALANLMLERGGWWSPDALAHVLHARNAGTITSHLRDLKASGVYTYERRRQGPLHEYRLSIRMPEQMPLFEGLTNRPSQVL